MRVHFIAIGGSAMHNLALALHLKGYTVSGSDDDIFEPAKSRLANYGLLPEQAGWFPEKIDKTLDAVILGMHAKADNPELAAAKAIGVRIFSYPEFLFEQSIDKTRIVIGGSHGKTTITAMILHVLKLLGIETDYMVGAKLEGFDVMVRLSESARFMIFEGDEYLTSAIDRRPKFHLYRPHIAVISGIAWDHINVFPTFENYLDQFRIFIKLIEKDGVLIYCNEDEPLRQLCENERKDLKKTAYSFPETVSTTGGLAIKHGERQYPLMVFGNHNLLNINAAWMVCRQMGVSDEDFLDAICSFKGAANRLECLLDTPQISVYKDFAHAPSKVNATVNAIKMHFPGRNIIACLELHTFSSLSKEFLSHYQGTLSEADEAIVYFNPHALNLKKLPSLEFEEIRQGFGREDLLIFNESDRLREYLLEGNKSATALLMMSSGDFDGIDLKLLAAEIQNVGGK